MQSLIRNYFKNGCLSKSDKLLALLFPKLVFSLNAKKIISLAKSNSSSAKEISETVSVTVEDYPYNNKHVIALGIFLQRNLKDDLAGAYVHGSVGTDELIAYSDFDALVIIKDAVFDDEKKLIRVALKLKEAEQFMYALDPLQHHGWFVLTESDLSNYNNHYFPVELFAHAKSILATGLKKLKIIIADDDNFQSPFIGLCKIIERTTSYQKCPQTLYDLKTLLSGFMLLPALYVQQRDGKAVFKKYSFEKAKTDFEKEEWKIMDQVSTIRSQWNQKNISLSSQKLAARFTIIPFLSKYFRTKTPNNLKQKINSDFLMRMNQFTEIIRTNIQDNK